MFAVASILHEKVILLNSLSYLWMRKCKAVNNASGSQMDSEHYPSQMYWANEQVTYESSTEESITHKNQHKSHW